MNGWCRPCETCGGVSLEASPHPDAASRYASQEVAQCGHSPREIVSSRWSMVAAACSAFLPNRIRVERPQLSIRQLPCLPLVNIVRPSNVLNISWSLDFKYFISSRCLLSVDGFPKRF